MVYITLGCSIHVSKENQSERKEEEICMADNQAKVIRLKTMTTVRSVK